MSVIGKYLAKNKDVEEQKPSSVIGRHLSGSPKPEQKPEAKPAEKPTAKPKTPTPAEPSLLSRALGTVERFSEASKDPFSKMGERAGQFTAEKIGQLFGVTPEQTQASQDILNAPKLRRMESVSPTTKSVADTAGNIAGSIVGLGMAGKVATPAVKALDKFGRPLLTDIAGQATTGALFEGANAIGNGGSPADALKKAGEGALLFGAAGPLGGLAGQGVKKLLSGTVGQYAGNLAKGATMGAGFSYGGNLLEGQPLDSGEAAKNAAVFGALDLILGGKAKVNRPIAEVIPEAAKPEPQRVPDSEVFTVDPSGTARAAGGPVALLPAGPSFKTNRYTAKTPPPRTPESDVFTVDPFGNTVVPGGPIALLPPGKQFKTSSYSMEPFIQKQTEKARQAYDEGITAIQNEYGHWDLRPQDVVPTAEKAGVNLEELLAGLQRAENPLTTRETLGNIANRSRMERVVGLKDVPSLTKPERLGYYGAKDQAIMQRKEAPIADNTESLAGLIGELTKKSSGGKANLSKPERLGYYGVQNGAVMQNKGLTKALPTIPTDKGVKLAPQLPKTEAQTNLLPKLPKVNVGANGGQAPDTSGRIVPAGQKGKFNLFDWMHKLYTKTVDTNHPLNRLSNKGDYGTDSIKVMANNAKNAPTIANHIIGEKLVDRTGRSIGEGYSKIVGQIGKQDIPAFNEYLLHKHNVSRMAQDKPVFGNGVTAEMSAAKVAEFEKANPEFKKVSSDINKFMQSFSKAWGVDSGRTSTDLMDMLKSRYPDYVPVYRAEDPNYIAMAKQGNLSTGNYIKTAEGGDSKIIYPTDSIPMLIEKTVKAARQNEVYQTILKAVERNPSEMRKWGISITQTGKDVLDELGKISGFKGMADFEQLRSDPKGGNILTVMLEGKPVSLRINNPDIFKSLIDLKTGHLSGGLETAARKASAPVKSLITGDNPFFGVFNMARDIPTYAVNSVEKNPFKALGNYAGAAKDVMTNSPTFQEFKALGGSGGNYFTEDIKGNIGKANIFRRFNNAVEAAPRLAEYKGTVNRGGGDYTAKQQGIYDANEVTTNFGRYGDLTKTADAGVMYLNAATQGLDKTVRQFINHPIATVLKGATVVTAPTLILNYVNSDNPYYKQLDNRTKDSYFLFPNKSDEDENGNAKTFFKLPKTRELGLLFGSLVERTLRATAGESKPFKGFGNAIATNFAPQNPLTQHFLAPLVYNLPKNKDFANRTIVPQSMQDRSPRLQYDEQTSEIAKKIGDITNLSPKQIDYIIKSYTGYVGQLALPATTKSSYQSGNGLQKTLKPIAQKFTADPLYNNDAIDDFYNNYDKLKQVAADKNFTENIPSKAITPEERARNAFVRASKEISMLTKKAKVADIKGDYKEVKRIRMKIIDIAERTNLKMPE